MKNSHLNWRLLIVCICLTFSVITVAYKIISVQVEDSIFLKNEGKKRYVKYRTINPVRGTIFDRNNFPLAVSIINYDNLIKYKKLHIKEYKIECDQLCK